MTDPFKLSRLEKVDQEYNRYYNKPVGLDSSKGTFYGYIVKETEEEIHMEPHLFYNPISLPDGKIINNIEKKDSTKIIPKSLLSKLVYEYGEYYFDELIKATNEQDTFSKSKFQKENLNQQSSQKLSFKQRLKAAYKVLKK